MNRRLTAPLVLTPDGLVRNTVVEVAPDGVVVSLWSCDSPDGVERLEYYNGILVPSFVNAHCHLELSFMNGKIARGGGFAEFARSMRTARADTTEQQRAEAVALRDAQMWSSGISVVGDVCNGASTFELKSHSKITYHNFIELFGLNVKDVSPLDDVRRKAVECGLSYSLAPHSMYSLSDEALGSVLHSDDGLLSIHLGESVDEMNLFGRTGRMWEWYSAQVLKCDFVNCYSSPVERLLSTVGSSRRVLLVHACCLTANDIRRVERHFVHKPVWVVCPRSNDYISALRPPLSALVECGSTVAVGTDSLASNTELSIIDELRAMPEVDLTQRLRWATEGGAAALGLEDRFGRIAVGLAPGITLVENVAFDAPDPLSSARSRRIL